MRMIYGNNAEYNWRANNTYTVNAQDELNEQSLLKLMNTYL